MSSSSPNEGPPSPFLVLADGAHNPASAETLGAYITHLLYQTFVSIKEFPRHEERPIVNLNITYILSLSHSPPKTSFQTLSLLLPLRIPVSTSEFADIEVSTTISVGLLRFTPPEGMPWIKCVPPTEVEAVVAGLIPDGNIWVAPDVDAKVEENESALGKALRWAEERK